MSSSSDAAADAGGEEVCSICLDPLQKAIKLPCNHEFCSSCIEKWRSKYDFESQRTCPHCRANLPPTREMVAQLQTYRQMISSIEALLESPLPISPTDPALFMLRDSSLCLNFSQIEDPIEQQVFFRSAIEMRLNHSRQHVRSLEQIVGDAEQILDQNEDEVEDLPTEIGRAAAGNDVEKVLKWLGPTPVPAKRINAKLREKMDRTLLHEAEFEGNIGLMTLLLQLGAKVDPRSAFGMSPFEQTCLNEELEDAARLLLAWGAVHDGAAPEDGSLPHENALRFAHNKKLSDLLQTPLGGRRCEIVGLQSRTDLNGCTGIAKRYLRARKRYEVEVEHTGESMAVRPENLRRRDRTPLDCGKFMVYRGKNEEDRPMFSQHIFCANDQESNRVIERQKRLESNDA